MMKIAGMTSESQAYVVTKDHAIRINEYLKILDPNQGSLLCEAIETHSYNRFMPLDPNSDMQDKRVLESMKNLGYDLDSESIYIAKVRLLTEARFPIETGSDVVSPDFNDLKNVLIKTTTNKGFIIGGVKNTDDIYPSSDYEYKNLFKVLNNSIVEDQTELPMLFPLWDMSDYPHIGVFGGSGSGKSFCIRVLIEEMMRLNIPAIVCDPHGEMTFDTPNNEFDDKYSVFVIGKDTGIDFTEISTQELIHLLKSRWEITESMESIIEILKKQGDSLDTFLNRMKSLLDIFEMGGLENAEKEKEYLTGYQRDELEKSIEIFRKYQKLVNDKSLKGVYWRMNSLSKTNIFGVKDRGTLNTLKSKKVIVFQGNRGVLTVYTAYVLRKLYYLRRAFIDGESEEYFPPFISVLDEAHNFAPKSIDSPSKQIIREISQEGRKYGVFLLLATQRPSILDDTTTAQLNSKFLFRTTRETDIKTIREETDISSEEAKRLPYLESGNTFFSSAILGRTIFVRVRKSKSTPPKSKNPFEELVEEDNKIEDEIVNFLINFNTIQSSQLSNVVDVLETYGINLSVDALKSQLEKMKSDGKIISKSEIFGEVYQLK